MKNSSAIITVSHTELALLIANLKKENIPSLQAGIKSIGKQLVN